MTNDNYSHSKLEASGKTFAGVVRKEVARTVLDTSRIDHHSSTPLQIMKICAEENLRASNIIVTGLEVYSDDDAVIRDIFTEIGVQIPSECKINARRIPAYRQDIPAWLLVKLNEGMVRDILKKSHQLIHSTQFPNVFVTPIYLHRNEKLERH
ncbi:hypothetical protein GJ496_006599 [Pomphorhynchus laevis]|nr:hypothetical protein GJ496_006599 [Pomphorhynchus laevis]